MAFDDSHIRVCGPPRRVIQEGERVIVEDGEGQRHELDVLYPALGCKVNSEFAAALGASCDPIGLIHADAHQRTNIAGLYAAGDVVSDLHQISVATAHAAIAATGIHNHLAPNMPFFFPVPTTRLGPLPRSHNTIRTAMFFCRGKVLQRRRQVPPTLPPPPPSWLLSWSSWPRS